MCRKKCFHGALSASSFQVCQIVGALKGDFSEDLSTSVEDLKKREGRRKGESCLLGVRKEVKNREISESDPSEHFSLPNWNRNHISVSTFIFVSFPAPLESFTKIRFSVLCLCSAGEVVAFPSLYRLIWFP